MFLESPHGQDGVASLKPLFENACAQKGFKYIDRASLFDAVVKQ
jgi:hypothetical protein